MALANPDFPLCLDDIIAALERADQSYVPPLGFHRAHSYRGDYSQLAVEPVAGVSVGDMLRTLKDARDSTFEGWKGGDYTMHGYVDVYIAAEGNPGDRIGPVLVGYLTGDLSRVPMGYR